MFQLVYASKSRAGLSDSDLVSLLAQARRRNAISGVTGVLLHMGGAFLQVLEGEEATIGQLFEDIRSDPRHGKVRTLLAQPVVRPMFRDWAMGFATVPEGIADEAGIFELTPRELEEQLDEERAQILMTLIRRLSENYGDSDLMPQPGP